MTELLLLSRTNKNLSAVPPCLHGPTRALSRRPTYTRQLTYALTLQNTLRISHLTAPSAAHLTACFLPAFQHRRLSVKASLPLSPLQRFIMLNFLYCIIAVLFCQVLLGTGFKKFYAIRRNLPDGENFVGHSSPVFAHSMVGHSETGMAESTPIKRRRCMLCPATAMASSPWCLRLVRP